MKKIVICGYHGFSNSGDEALLWAMIDIIKSKYPDVHLTVLSKHPRSTAALYNVSSVYRYDLFKIHKLFKSSDLFVFGGGSLLQDVTSTRSLYYYLTIINIALKVGIKVMLYGNGVGPLIRKKSRSMTSKCLNRVDLITLRDDLSDKLLAQIGVNKPPIRITADPAFTLRYDNLERNDVLLEASGIKQTDKYAVIAVREWKNAVPDFERIIAKLCDTLNTKYGIRPLFVPMQYCSDIQISKSIISKMDTTGLLVEKELDVSEVFSVIAHSEMAVGMRLHTLIYATTLGVPAIALSYDPKVTAFMQSINQPLCADVESIREEELSSMLDSLIPGLDKRKAALTASLSELRAKAEENASLAISLLE